MGVMKWFPQKASDSSVQKCDHYLRLSHEPIDHMNHVVVACIAKTWSLGSKSARTFWYGSTAELIIYFICLLLGLSQFYKTCALFFGKFQKNSVYRYKR